MKNKLTDLNNHLFAQIERLSDESITPEDLKRELQRTAGIKDIAKEIIANAQLVLDAQTQISSTKVIPDLLT